MDLPNSHPHLRPHQLKAVHELSNGNILAGDPGSGKSRAALAYFLQATNDRPCDVYVVTTARKRDDLDWLGDAVLFDISTARADSVSGSTITVESWNNIEKLQDVKNAFFIFDEQKVGGAGAWVRSFLKITKYNKWIILTGTPGDNWMDYVPMFIANGFYKNRTAFKDEHAVYSTWTPYPKIDRYVGLPKLNRLRDSITVRMPIVRHTTRHVLIHPVEHDQARLEQITKHRWNIFEGRPLKDISELYRAARMLVNSDVSRMGSLMKLSERHPRIVVFYNFNYELKMLRATSRILHVPTGEWNGHNHDPIPDSTRWLYLVQYTAGAEAWNCVTTDTMVFWSLNYSYKVMEQAKGRIDRLNTEYEDLFYYIFRSSSWIDRAIQKSYNEKRVFNEARSKVPWPRAGDA